MVTLTKGNSAIVNSVKKTYLYKDHLGNIRLSYSDSDNNGAITTSEIIEENNYYPFGLKHKGYNSVVSASTNDVANKFKFNGKEQEKSLGYNMYEMDVRSLDPALGRWTTIDPVTHHSMSTYNAFDNNPVLFADPSGADGMIGSNGGAGWALWSGMMGTQQIFSDFSNIGASQFNNQAQQPNSSEKNVNDFNGNGSNTANSVSGAISDEEWAKFLTASTELAEVTVVMNNKASYDAAIINVVGQIYATDWYDSNSFDSNMIYSGIMIAVNGSVGTTSAAVYFKGKYFYSNEIFHKQKNGWINRLTRMKNGQLKWNNNIVSKHKSIQLAKVKGVRNISNKLTKLGGVLIVADIALSGELKVSHGINAIALVFAATGVGAPVALVWFVVDFGTMGVNYLLGNGARGIGDLIDENVGSYEMYDGLY